jgi:hypothetical protein
MRTGEGLLACILYFFATFLGMPLAIVLIPLLFYLGEEYLGPLSGFWWFNDTHLSS